MLKNFDEVIEKVRAIEPFTVSVAAAADKELLQAVKAAADLGFVRPVLVGDAKAVGDICADIGLRPLDILPAQGEDEAVAVAVRAVKDGGAQVLMKGLVNTSIYMRGILNKEHGLRTGRLLSMMAVYEAPGYHKLVYCSDSGINVAPTFEQKKDILKNILITTRAIGLENPRVAALTANAPSPSTWRSIPTPPPTRRSTARSPARPISSSSPIWKRAISWASPGFTCASAAGRASSWARPIR